MKQSQFEHLHQGQWLAFEHLLTLLEHGTSRPEASETFAQDYRRLCQHLALAQARGYSSHLVDSLQQLALRGHQQLYRRRHAVGASILAFMLAGFPRLVRQQWRFVLLACLVFFGSLLLAGLLVYAFPDLIYSLMEPARVAQTEAMYDPDQSRLGPAAQRLAGQDWMMFGYYIMNNIGIAFQTFASGLLLGLGSLFFLLFNGLMIGAVAGHLTEIGYVQTFWPFVVGHGAFELTAIALSGAAGLKLGWALVAPGRLSRSQALRQAANIAIQLVYGVIAMLLIAAFIEAYWSSRTDVSSYVKYAVGALAWLAVGSYLSLGGRHHAPD